MTLHDGVRERYLVSWPANPLGELDAFVLSHPLRLVAREPRLSAKTAWAKKRLH